MLVNLYVFGLVASFLFWSWVFYDEGEPAVVRPLIIALIWPIIVITGLMESVYSFYLNLTRRLK